MDYLAICNRLAQEAGVNGDPLLSTVSLQTGERKRICDWANDALREVLGTQLWPFLWEQVDLLLPAGASTIATTLPASRWDKDNVWMVPVTSDNADRELDYVEWRDFSMHYRRLNTPGSITAWTIRPDNAIAFNAVGLIAPNTTINVQRWKLPVPMVNPTDQPPFDEDLHMLVVYVALKKYAGYDEAGNQRTIAVDEVKTLREAMNSRYMPAMTFGGSLLDLY